MKILENILAIIPARGGSKRVKNKNIINICDKPIISWPLLEVSKLIKKKHIIVSTDDMVIAKVVKDLGFKVPFIRPVELADDFTTSSEVVKHALNWYEENFSSIDYVLIIYPTAIFYESSNLIEAVELMKKNPDCKAVFSASKYPHPIERALGVDETNNVEMLSPKHHKTRTQDLKDAYYDAGQFYLCKSDIIRNSENILSANSKCIIFPKIRSVDIDSIDDIELAEILFKNKLKKS